MSHRRYARVHPARIAGPRSAIPSVRAAGRAAGRVANGLAGGLLALVAIASPGRAEPVERPGTPPAAPAVQSLDEQVQEIKSDVLAIAAELANLEEKLLYPSDSQLAVFVAVDQGEKVEIDSARISLDGELIAQHVYGFKELEALAKGGVQRLHTASIATGGHRLEVAIAGRRGGEQPFELVEAFEFAKEVGPARVGIRLANGATGQPTVRVEAW